MNHRISLHDFPGTPSQQLSAAGDYCRANPGTTLLIPPGKYVLSDPRAKAIQEAVLSGAYGNNPQPVMFHPAFSYTHGLDLTDCHDITVEAYGVSLCIDGFLEPLTLHHASDIRICGLQIDHLRKPFSLGIIIAADDAAGTIDILPSPATPFDERASSPRIFVVESDTGHISDTTFSSDDFVERKPHGLLRYRCRFSRNPVGFAAYFTHTFHFRPAILISHSERVTLEDVTIHSMAGMGIVGFKSEDIVIRRLQVVPSPGFHMSTNTDATHFACCRGTILVEHSLFAGHGDDAINVHNYYYTPISCDDSLTTVILTVRTPDGTHAQQPDIPKSGYTLQLVDKHSLVPLDTYRVVKSTDTTDPCHVLLDHPLPADAAQNTLFANLTEQPTLIFRHNIVHDHLARAVLCKTSHATISDNAFLYSTGTAIHVAAEAQWGEGIAPSDVTISGNTFDCCGLTRYGRYNMASAVSVNISAANTDAVGILHNICITDNYVILPPTCRRAFYLANATGVRLHGNIVENTGGCAPLCIHCCTDTVYDLPCE